ncbi:MAG: hypothetical protein LBT30_04570 [Clostridiales bacterium]|jgi:alkylhydroperoxidase family enzyme|nr:hypothetical protein [Clostridiales bacterium]
MPRISIKSYEALNEEAKKEYDGQIKKHGRITNMKKTLLHSVPSFRVLMEWYTLRDEAVKAVGEFPLNVFAYAISHGNDCLICSTFFRKILRDAGQNPDALQLDDTSSLLMEYAAACVAKPVDVSDALFAKMRARFDEQQIVLLTAFAGMMIATNLINNTLEVELDDYLTSYTKK